MRLSFQTTVIDWRGPAPYFFAPVPPEHAEAIRRTARLVSYGWGMIPVEVRLGVGTFTTSLFPKDGGYLLPLKDSVRRAHAITSGDTISIDMTLHLPGRRSDGLEESP